MVRLQFAITLHYEVDAPHCDFIFGLHAARTTHQKIIRESLNISRPVVQSLYTDTNTQNRLLRVNAGIGPLSVHYEAVVDIDHHVAHPHQVNETPVGQLPGPVLQYLYASRYCQSDRLQQLAFNQFGKLSRGYRRVQAIRDWVANKVRFQSNSSNSNTTAVDTLVEEVGVCRDFAHVMIALCRAISIPARFVSGIDYGADPAMGPTDFHAYVEVYLDGRWYLFDPSNVAIPMGFVRLGTGRDAADTSFASMYGSVRSNPPVVQIEALMQGPYPLEMPRLVDHALSTYAELATTT